MAVGSNIIGEGVTPKYGKIRGEGQCVYIIRWDFDECFMFHGFFNKRLDGGTVGVVLIPFNKPFRPVAENVN
jgi:hypothetical protein